MKNSIPVFFQPTRKILLDDDNTFTQSVLLKMHGKYFSAMNSITDGLNYFSEEYKPKINKNNLAGLNEHAINIQFENSHEDISILFIDYHMPEMTGLDFLQKIKGSPIKKVLVTGEHDYTIAIDAFNSGMIDAYIRKNDPDLLIKFQHITAELEWKYFTDLSQLVSDLPGLDYLKNPNVIKFFMEFLTDRKITEFYLIDKQGTFCASNIKGEKEYFVLRNIMQLQQLSELAAEDGASEKTVNDLAEGKAIPFFNFKEHWEIPAGEWDGYLHTANELPGDSGFLWAIVKPDFSTITDK